MAFDEKDAGAPPRSSVRMKHMMSGASDMELDYQILEAEKQVLIHVRHLDSMLLEDFIIRLLQRDLGLDVICDDNHKGFRPVRPTWKMKLFINDIAFDLAAYKLMSLSDQSRYSITLYPAKVSASSQQSKE